MNRIVQESPTDVYLLNRLRPIRLLIKPPGLLLIQQCAHGYRREIGCVLAPPIPEGLGTIRIVTIPMLLMVHNYHHNRGRYRDLKASLHAFFRSCLPPSHRQTLTSHLAGGMTGQQCFAGQRACCLSVPYGSCSHLLEFNSAPVYTYQHHHPCSMS